MERVKSLLSPGKHADDNVMYESATDRLKKGGLNSESSHVEHVQEPIRQPQTSDIVVDSSPERVNEHNSHIMPARSSQDPDRKEMPGAYGAQTESRNPYTKHSVDPRIGVSKQQQQPSAQNEYRNRASSEYSKEVDGSQPQRYADTSKTAGNTASTQRYGRDSRSNSMKQEHSGTTASKTNQNYSAVPPGAEASGQYRTRIASFIDPNVNSGGPLEDGYHHSPTDGGGGETADKFHRRKSRTISVSNSTAEAGGVQANRTVSNQSHAEPQDVNRRSQGTWATAGDKGEEAGMGNYSSRDKEAGRGGVDVQDYTQKPYEGQQGQSTAATTQSTATTTQPTAATIQPKTAADYYSSTSAAGADYGGSTQAGASGKQYNAEAPQGNQYGAAGTTRGEAAAFRNQNQAETNPTGAAQRQVETNPTGATQRPTAATQREAEPLRAQGVASQSAPKGSRRRSSILSFLHLGRGKKDSREEEQLANKERQTYAANDRDRPIGTAATRTGNSGANNGGAERATQRLSGDPATLVQRNRQMSTIDAPAFSGGLLDENGNPLDPAAAQKLPETSSAGPRKGPSTDTTGAAGTAGAGGASTTAAGTRTADRVSVPKGAAVNTAYDSGAPTEPVAANAYGGSQVTEAEEQGLMADYRMQGGEGERGGRGGGGALGDDLSPRSSAAQAPAGFRIGNGRGAHSKVVERGGHNVLHKEPPAGHAVGNMAGYAAGNTAGTW